MTFLRSKSPRLTSIRKIVIYALLILTTTAEAQFRLDPYSISELLASSELDKKSLFTKSSTHNVNNANHVSLETEMKYFEKWMNSKNKLVQSELYFPEMGKRKIYFTAYDFFEPGFKFYLSDNETQKEIILEKGIHLKGILNNDLQSMASVSLFKNSISGIVQVDRSNCFSLTPAVNDKNKIITNISRVNLENGNEVMAS
ncbi:MAG: hypothetical protein WAT21_05535, partial [Saprospiraceae bacterium]